MNGAYLPQHLNMSVGPADRMLSLSPTIPKEQISIPVPRVPKRKVMKKCKTSDGSVNPIRRPPDATRSERASRTVSVGMDDGSTRSSKSSRTPKGPISGTKSERDTRTAGGPSSTMDSSSSSSSSMGTTRSRRTSSVTSTTTSLEGEKPKKKLSRSKTIDSAVAPLKKFPANPSRSAAASPLRNSTGSSPMTTTTTTEALKPLRRTKSNAEGLKKKKISTTATGKTLAASVSPVRRVRSAVPKKNHSSLSNLKETPLKASLHASQPFDSSAALSSSTEENPSTTTTTTPSRRCLRPSLQATRKIRTVRIAEMANVVHTYEGSEQDASTFWYSKQDLKMLMDHELQIFARSKGTKHALHCCTRGVEQILKGENKERKIAKYVLMVLKWQQDQRKGGSTNSTCTDDEWKELQVFSQNLTKEDRKRARKFGMKDAADAGYENQSSSSSNNNNNNNSLNGSLRDTDLMDDSSIRSLGDGARLKRRTTVKPQMMSMKDSVRLLMDASLGDSMRGDSMRGNPLRESFRGFSRPKQSRLAESSVLGDTILSLTNDAKPFAGRREGKE